ncbi:RING finger protein [Zostera marina]|uniref:RING-type E3 ubiquitin transferase n=1 Tax=Zostera marina TaxID=29655 RepID=A0A0K9PAM6_ZOSMR|nr:RING finger protein [Zostera marina]
METSSATMILPEEPLLRSRPQESVSTTSLEPWRRPNRLAVILGRATGRRGPASEMMRERAASQLDVRRAEWGYSRPVVAIDMVWNLAFALAAVVVLSSTVNEKPNVPVRVWLIGYALQCIFHTVLVWVEYHRRNANLLDDTTADMSRNEDFGDGLGVESMAERMDRRFDFARRFESINALLSFLWWVVGFYWIVCGGEIILRNAPKLYWLAVVFLAFDLFFAIFCVVLACVIGIALCFCLPCVIAIIYALAGQEGASDADINILHKYRYKKENIGDQKITKGSGTMIPMENETSDMMIAERVLLQEDAECCVCLTPYEDGVEVHSLPCNHHFHSTCIVKWLRINAICPLCKYNILKGSEQV